jgi:isoleucyl-tRNA synthetase
MLNSELDVLKFWENESIFEKSIENRKGAPRYVFFEGPPFLNGTPHLGHFSTGFPKDIFPRYWTQKGKYVPRRWGWDCHGLPVENFVQKQLGITDKREIENEIGIDKFNQSARQSLLTTDVVWRKGVQRSGRWVDMNDQYRTMDIDYMESVWWGLSQLWNKNLLYEDYRVSLYSPSMGVTLSHIEINDDIVYEQEKISSPVVRFEVKAESSKKLFRKIIEEISFNYSEQLRYKADLDDRIEQMERVEEKGKKSSLKDILSNSQNQLERLDWDELKTDLESGQEIEYLKEQRQVIYQNIETLEKLKNILNKEYPLRMLSWTTTPWTLPANVALGVGPDIEYSIYFLPKTSELVLLAENRVIKTLSLVFADKIINTPDLDKKLSNITDSGEYFEILGIDIIKVVTMSGSDLDGVEYKPLFEHPDKISEYEEKANVYKVYSTDIVTEEEGTGVLHIAPAYGPEDFEIKKERGLPLITSLNEYGEIRSDLDSRLKPVFGMNFAKANTLIVEILEKHDLLFATVDYDHKYPVFNRDNKKVYYNAEKNWYIGETLLLPQTLEKNKNINWYPEHLKYGRFQTGLESAPDWCISRNRYWGNPLPIWRTRDTSKTIFVDSLETLRQKAINPIYRIINDRNLNPELYEEGRVVILSDAQSKLPLGITATQYRSKFLSDIRKESTLTMQHFASSAQKILDEILELFEKYDTVQILFNPEEQRMWTTWLYTLHPNSKKVSNVFYFYRKVEEEYDELKPVGPVKLLDLHRPYIDEIILKDDVDNHYYRIEDVMDCWVESGSMPWASYHYPFQNKEIVENSVPADYIVEYEGQIRGWFHALHVLGVGVLGKEVFKNVHSHGTLLGHDGKKMSKSKQNYRPYDEYFEKYGSDALRLFFVSSPYFMGENLVLNEKEMKDVFRDSTLLMSNSIRFIQNVLTTHQPYEIPRPYSHPLNRWWSAYTKDFAYKLDTYLSEYNLIEAARLVVPYIQDFSTWYIRRSKDLLSTHGQEIATCLIETGKIFATITASLQPFNTERLWSVIRTNSDEQSIHLTSIPEYSPINEKQSLLLDKMNSIRELISEIHAVRKKRGIRVRQPLYADFSQFKLDEDFVGLIAKECNLLIKDLSKTEGELYERTSDFGYLKIDLVVDHDLSVLGFTRDFERAVQAFRKAQGFRSGQLVPMKWQVAKTYDQELFNKVIQTIDWSKLFVEIKWVNNLDENLDKKFIVKDLAEIIVD